MSGLSDEDIRRFFKHIYGIEPPPGASIDVDALLEAQRRALSTESRRETLHALESYLELVKEQEMLTRPLGAPKESTPTNKPAWLTFALAFLVQFAFGIYWITDSKSTATAAKELAIKTEAELRGRLDEISRTANDAKSESGVNKAQISAIDNRLTRIENKLDRVLETK